MSDALDRLKQRKRPKVQPRSTQVSPETVDIQTHRHTEVKRSSDPETTGTTSLPSDLSEDIQTQRHLDIKTSRHISLEAPEALEVKRSTFRLEVGLISRLHRLCQDHGLSREVMIESMFEYMENDSEALKQVLEVAETKNVYRQQIANRKRAESMIKKFGQ